jgi:transcriptional regulator with XRE-family HTH domain
LFWRNPRFQLAVYGEILRLSSVKLRNMKRPLPGLSERLRELLAERNAREWAEELGIPHRTLLQYLSGETDPPASFIALILRKTTADPLWLLLGADGASTEEPTRHMLFRQKCASLARSFAEQEPGTQQWIERKLDEVFPPQYLERWKRRTPWPGGDGKSS